MIKSLIAFFATLVFGAVLLLAYPDTWISPGHLTEGHAKISANCASCHTPGQSATPEKCQVCHRVDQIGLTRVDGSALPISATTSRTRFHVALTRADCAGCHTLHPGQQARRDPSAFQHEFLDRATRTACATCHTAQAPKDARHTSTSTQCGSCHQTKAWKPATFDHAALSSAGGTCVSCHAKVTPANAIHQQAAGDCGTCHRTTQWKPADFEHTRYFAFDGDHPSTCATCHKDAGTFKTYTCYGCHAHTPASIASKHREERITNIDNCARCHRSSRDRGEGGEGGEGRRRREGDGRERSRERGGEGVPTRAPENRSALRQQS